MDSEFADQYEAILNKHYQALGGTFDENAPRHDEDVRTHMEYLIELFDCKPEHQVAELAAGTCICTKELIHLIGFKKPVLCVDPCLDMLKFGEEHPSIQTLCLDAVAFAKEKRLYDRIFCRAAVHHFGKDLLPEIFSGIFNQLTSSGVFVIISMHGCETRPWFKKLKAVYPVSHIPAELMNETLRGCGFSLVEQHVKDHNARVTKASLFRSFRERYVSILNLLSDDDIEEGIKEIEKCYPNMDVIEFIDKYDFFVAKK